MFHEDGEAIERRKFHKVWTEAREAAQLPDLIPLDLRRSAVRQLERARRASARRGLPNNTQ